MKKLLLSIFIASSFAANAQVTILTEGFESYQDFAITGFGDWITIDMDGLPTYIGGSDLPEGFWSATWNNAGDPQAYMIFNPSTASGELIDGTPSGVSNSTASCDDGENRNFNPHTGSKYAGSWASVPSETGGPTANNDFLITPLVTLGATNTFKFWAKSLSSCYGSETFRVYIYTGTTTPTSMTGFTELTSLNLTASNLWTQKTVTIPTSYDGQQVRLGILNNGADHYMLMVDDVTLTAASLGVNEVLSAKFSVYPNPADNLINITNSESIQVNEVQIADLNGRIVKTVKTNAVNDIQINISDLSSGMYMMNISSEQGKAVKKIVKN